jgi:hypothetical protein
MAHAAHTLNNTFSKLTILPDSAVWVKRMEVKSASSGKTYVVSQNARTMEWGCSCPGWRFHRKCKHTAALAALAN